MKKLYLIRLLAFLIIFAAGAAFVFIVGTYRSPAIRTYPVEPSDGNYSSQLALIGDRAARDCSIEADHSLFLDGELDVAQISDWLSEKKPQKLIIFLECTPAGELNERLNDISRLTAQAMSYCETVYLMAAPPPLEHECNFTFRPMYVRQNNHALENIAKRYGAVYFEEHTVLLAATTGAVAEQYVGEGVYFSPAGVELVLDAIAKNVMA